VERFLRSIEKERVQSLNTQNKDCTDRWSKGGALSPESKWYSKTNGSAKAGLIAIGTTRTSSSNENVWYGISSN
jgi:hypothetical protein